jgi:hypothetical protein
LMRMFCPVKLNFSGIWSNNKNIPYISVLESQNLMQVEKTVKQLEQTSLLID